MKYGIANIKGGSGGTTIPTLTITQSQLGGGGFTPTQEQISIMQNNDIIIFDCAYIGKKLVMQKVRWDGIFSQNALTPQTTIVFTSNFNSPDIDNKYIAGLQLALPENSNVCYMNTTDISIPEASQSVCFTTATPTIDGYDTYFDLSDIDGTIGDYSVIVQTDANNVALKIYSDLYVDGENELVYVSEKASFGGGGFTTYLHNVLLSISTSPLFAYCCCVVKADTKTAVTTLSELATLLYNNGYVSASKIAVLSGMCRNTSINKTFIFSGIYSPDGTSVKAISGESSSSSFSTSDPLSGYSVEDFVK